MIERRILPESRETSWDKRGDEVSLSADFERSCSSTNRNDRRRGGDKSSSVEWASDALVLAVTGEAGIFGGRWATNYECGQ
jgi:hypothetical protein